MDNDDTVPNGMITVAQAARRLGRSIEQVRRYLREGKLPGRRIGQQWFIEEQAVRAGYQPSKPQYGVIRETAVMEANTSAHQEIEALIRDIDEQREAIRRRLGGDLKTDVVEMLRIDREEH